MMSVRVVSKSKLIGALVLALVLVNIQCVAFCAVASCDPTGTQPRAADVPPCHQHHQETPHPQHSAPCAHQLIPAAVATARATSTVILGNPVAALPDVAVLALPAAGMDRVPAAVLSPPGLRRFSSLVLRI